MGFLEIGFAMSVLSKTLTSHPCSPSCSSVLSSWSLIAFVLVKVSVAARKKHHDQSNCVPSKDAPTGTQTGQEPKGQESREGFSLLAYSSCLAIPAFL